MKLSFNVDIEVLELLFCQWQKQTMSIVLAHVLWQKGMYSLNVDVYIVLDR